MTRYEKEVQLITVSATRLLLDHPYFFKSVKSRPKLFTFESRTMKPKPVKAARDARPRARALRSIFLLLTLLGLIINLDGGAVPASVDVIREHFALLPWQVGLLGSLVYFGTAAGSVVAGSVVGRLSPLSATRAAVVLNTCATAGFGLAPSSSAVRSSRPPPACSWRRCRPTSAG